MKIENSVGKEVMQLAEKYWIIDKNLKGEVKGGCETFSWNILLLLLMEKYKKD